VFFQWAFTAFARQVFYHLRHTSSHFCPSYFEDSVLLFASTGLDPPIYISFIVEMIGVYHAQFLLVGMESCELFA
jgi:hypothetical protein